MKKPLLLCILLAHLSMSHAAALSPLHPFPLGTNTIAGTNAPFWSGGIPIDLATGVTVWQLVQEVKATIDIAQTNFNIIATNFANLTDTQTNAVLNSPKVAAFTTNSFTVPYGTTNWIRFTVTNFAGMDYTVLSGSPTLMVSFDFGTNWQNYSTLATLFTNVPVTIGWRVTGFPPSSSFYLPVDGVLTNITLYKQARADLYAKTNSLYGQSTRTSYANNRDEVVPLGQVQDLLAGAQLGSFQNDAQLNGHSFNWDAAWQTTVRSDNTNNALRISFLGEDQVVIHDPSATIITGSSIAMDGTGTNCIVTVHTNGLSAPPRLQFSHLLIPLKWAWLATPAPVVTGTNYVITFPAPALDQGFFLTLVPSTLPSVFTLSGLLQLPFLNVTSSTNTTWGYGGGLIGLTLTTNGLYLVGSQTTNLWGRTLLSTNW